MRQDVLLRAKNLCLDLIGLNQERLLLEERRKNADELLVLFEKRLSEGDASALEVNKIKMERMNVQTEAAQNAAAHRTALQQLLAMNGNQPLEFDETSYPNVPPVADYNTLYDEVIASDVALQTADAQVRAAEKEVGVNKQNWLPSIEVGYRRNTSISNIESCSKLYIGVKSISSIKKFFPNKARALILFKPHGACGRRRQGFPALPPWCPSRCTGP